jgi:putative phage-type endonuclease
MDRAQWLEERRSGIGGSDVAPMLGLSPWKTPFALWQDKTGRAVEVEPDEAQRERMHFGTVLEDVVAREHAARTGQRVQRVTSMLRHPDVPIALANLDRAIVEDGSRARWDQAAGRVLGARGILECKTAHALAQNSADWGEPGTDQVPAYYWMQVQWYLGIARLPYADLACLFGGQRFVIYTIASDAAIFSDLLSEADRWWRAHVVADVPPQPRTEDEARALWRSHVAGRSKIVDVKVADAVQQLIDVKAQIKALEDREQALRDLVLPAFGDAEAIEYMGRRLATWRQNNGSTKTDWRAAYLDLRDAILQSNALWSASFPEYKLPFDIEVIDGLLRDTFTTTTEGARVLRLNTKESSA